MSDPVAGGNVTTAIEVLKLFPKGARPSQKEQSLYDRALEVLAESLGCELDAVRVEAVPVTNPPAKVDPRLATNPVPLREGPVPPAGVATTTPPGAVPPFAPAPKK